MTSPLKISGCSSKLKRNLRLQTRCLIGFVARSSSNNNPGMLRKRRKKFWDLGRKRVFKMPKMMAGDKGGLKETSRTSNQLTTFMECKSSNN